MKLDSIILRIVVAVAASIAAMLGLARILGVMPDLEGYVIPMFAFGAFILQGLAGIIDAIRKTNQKDKKPKEEP